MDPTELLRQRLHRLGQAHSGRPLGPQQHQHVVEQPDPAFQLQPLTVFGGRADVGAPMQHSNDQAKAASVPHGKVYARNSASATLGKAAAGTQDLRTWLPLGGRGVQHKGLDLAANDKENSSCLLGLKHSSSAAANNKRLQQLKLSAMTEETQMRTEDRFPLAAVDANRPPTWVSSAHKKSSSRLSHSLSMSDGKPSTAAAKGGLGAWDLFTNSPLSVRQLSQEEEQPAGPRGSRSPPLPRAPAPTPTASPSQSRDPLQDDDMDTSSSGGGAADASDPSWEAGRGSGTDEEDASMSTSSSNSGGAAAAAGMAASEGDAHWGGQPAINSARGPKQPSQKKRRAADALAQAARGMHQATGAGVRQGSKAAKARHPAADKQLTAAQLPEGHVPLQLPSAALVNAAKMVLLEMPPQFDVSGDMGAVGRLERAGPTLQEQVSLEEEEAAGAVGGAAASGMNGSGMGPQGGAGGAQQVHLDLKGVMYGLEHLPLAGSCAVVKMGGPGGAAQVEHVFQSFVRAQPRGEQLDAGAGAYLNCDSSADEAAPAGGGGGWGAAAEGKGVGGAGGKAQGRQAQRRKAVGGRGRGGSKVGAGAGRAAGGVRKRGAGGGKGQGGSKAATARQQPAAAAAAAAAQVAAGGSKAGRRKAPGSDSDDDYAPSN